MTADSALELRRRLAALPANVFAAFADPAIVSRWLKPSQDVRLEVLKYEFRVGGSYRFAYHVPGGPIMHVNGVFKTIDAPSRLVFSWNIEPPDEHAGILSEVRVAIRPYADGCDLTINHIELTHPGAAKRHEEGWQGAVSNLSTLLLEGKA